MKEFTVAEVAAHNTREDLYMIIHDEVYEISKFVTEVRFNILDSFELKYLETWPQFFFSIAAPR